MIDIYLKTIQPHILVISLIHQKLKAIIKKSTINTRLLEPPRNVVDFCPEKIYPTLRITEDFGQNISPFYQFAHMVDGVDDVDDVDYVAGHLMSVVALVLSRTMQFKRCFYSLAVIMLLYIHAPRHAKINFSFLLHV
jgi:hypothetical protein